ncbi:MAG: DUF3253 domain-containing protein [Planctomycetota bacterium]
MTAEAAILSLLSRRGAGKTICPSEAARLLDWEDWRPLMPAVREAAQSLVTEGRIVATQRGEVVDLDTAAGPVRLGLSVSPR